MLGVAGGSLDYIRHLQLTQSLTVPPYPLRPQAQASLVRHTSYSDLTWETMRLVQELQPSELSGVQAYVPVPPYLLLTMGRAGEPHQPSSQPTFNPFLGRQG